MLIGGANRAYRLDPMHLSKIAEGIATAVQRAGGSVLVTPSRRTGAAGVAVLRERFAGLPGLVWDGGGDNPYFAFLALADALLVTADSVSMVSEAAATGKPVHILEMAGGDAKFYQDFRRLLDRKDIDAVHIATPDHWHAIIAIAAVLSSMSFDLP